MRVFLCYVLCSSSFFLITRIYILKKVCKKYAEGSARFETVRDDDFYIMLSLSKLSLNERLPGARETHLELSGRSDARSLVGFSFSFVCRFSSRRRQIILRASGS